MTTTDQGQYWIYHAWFVAVWPAFAVVILATAVFDSEIVTTLAVGTIGVVTFAAGWGSLIGYYVEAKRFKKSDSEWVPKWAAYVVLHFIFTPFIIAPVYLIDRYRAVGLPTHQLKTLVPR